MPNGPDYILDIKGLKGPGGSNTPSPSTAQGRPWLSVRWKCCGVYNRVYRNKDATAYEGKCPRCGTPVRALIGSEGTSNRFFEAS